MEINIDITTLKIILTVTSERLAGQNENTDIITLKTILIVTSERFAVQDANICKRWRE